MLVTAINERSKRQDYGKKLIVKITKLDELNLTWSNFDDLSDSDENVLIYVNDIF